ncbi:MAG: hypothetical protein KME42_13845 [Tildeniella nuda ZEHNDER 1965/U140]|jgi:hypothetical protein|nr:hypothetical protein [Tildeniella nuda ZEHNDER 1965/U140]
MPGLMQWRSNSLSSNAKKELYVQDPGHTWRHYRLSQHYQPDRMSFGGMQTQVECAARGYQLLRSDEPLPAVELRQMDEPKAPMMPLAGLSEVQRQRWTA